MNMQNMQSESQRPSGQATQQQETPVAGLHDAPPDASALLSLDRLSGSPHLIRTAMTNAMEELGIREANREAVVGIVCRMRGARASSMLSALMEAQGLRNRNEEIPKPAPSLKNEALSLGNAVIFSLIVDQDLVLAEGLLMALQGNHANIDRLRPEITSFVEHVLAGGVEKRHGLFIGALVLAGHASEASPAESSLLQGILEPLLVPFAARRMLRKKFLGGGEVEVTESIPKFSESRIRINLSGITEIFPAGVNRLQLELLETVVNKIRRNAEVVDAVKKVFFSARPEHPVLAEIIRSERESRNLLRRLWDFIDHVRAVSDKDLAALVAHLPRSGDVGWKASDKKGPGGKLVEERAVVGYLNTLLDECANERFTFTGFVQVDLPLITMALQKTRIVHDRERFISLLPEIRSIAQASLGWRSHTVLFRNSVLRMLEELHRRALKG
jgi:hypothetical protein